jgi:uncharacterized membrane protein
MDRLMFYGTLAAVLGSGLIAGAFFVFSVGVMPALRRLPANEGMAAMQSINSVIQNPAFLGVFMGTALLSIVLAVMSFLDWRSGAPVYILAGAALYVVGSFLLTVIFNVPLNNALDAADPKTAAGHEVWNNNLATWTFWNHIRTIASLLATAAFALSLRAN